MSRRGASSFAKFGAGLLLGIGTYLVVLTAVYGVGPTALVPPGVHPFPSPKIMEPGLLALERVAIPSRSDQLLVPSDRTTQVIFPGGQGLGEGGTPILMATSPDGRAFGLFVRDPAPNRGGWMQGEVLQGNPISFTGLPSTYNYELSMPGETILLVSARIGRAGGVVGRHLFQLDAALPERVETIADDLFYRHVQWTGPNGSAAVAYGQGRRWLGINREHAGETWIRVYRRGPGELALGRDAVRIPVLAGDIVRGGWIDSRRFAFVTSRTTGSSSRREERGWILTLPPIPSSH